METESEHVIISEDIENGRSEEEESKDWRRRHRKSQMFTATLRWNWREIREMLEKDKETLTETLNFSGDTLLQSAVQQGRNDVVEKLLLFIQKEDVKEILELKKEDGSTALHVAVRAGNKHAMKLLVDKHNELLIIPNKKGQDPLLLALHDMQFDAFVYLLKATTDYDKTNQLLISQGPDYKQKGASLLVNAITAKQYGIASELINRFPEFAVQNDEVLMAIARTFPTGLNYWEALISPSTFRHEFYRGYISFSSLAYFLCTMPGWKDEVPLISRVAVSMFLYVRRLMRYLIWMVFFLFRLAYLPLWKVVARVVPLIQHIEKKIKELKKAQEVLNLVCDQIDNLNQSFYNKPILEAVVQNSPRVFLGISRRSKGRATESNNRNGYDIFQLAVIHRSEKIYNLIYKIGKDKNHNRTIKDSSENTMLHLAGRLAPSYVLTRRTGAALQLQQELQWFEELKTFMHSSAIIERNIFGETPPQVFTREHENLVKEGEQWMKTTAESCSITAALITTIVFAAAITVPGGSNQETGIPVFRKDVAFTIFAIANAISLVTSSSSLMVFLSILTARFAEKDFLVTLPKRLIIGLVTLLLSITAMMVAFGTTLYLLFAREKPWMLGPICGFSCLPILFFVTLQFPLIADLYRSTYVPVFDKMVNSIYVMPKGDWHVSE
ncbi:hypothetical protein OSB04_001506 [Centaurea solstitialis]|uniref:PGG domain-containing protein n=1 Tax=Centaurea solstitialis TaxID=347529 RepID=A0AA38U2T9_9ASTR|nr:hypothetical protein OSB04_001506 [Centaurea solstitialis]